MIKARRSSRNATSVTGASSVFLRLLNMQAGGWLLAATHSNGAYDATDGHYTWRLGNGQSVRVYRLKNLDLESTLVRVPQLLVSEQSKTIKWEKKVRVSCVPLAIGGTLKVVYIKQHNVLSLWRRLVSVFHQSAALRSLSGATTLLKQGFATASPVAAVEYRSRGLLIKSFYLSEEITGAKSATNFWREDLLRAKGREGYLKRRAMLRGLARLFQSLHVGNIYHNDLKASNILVLDSAPTSDRKFHLVDLQGLKKCLYISERRRVKNLAQLNRTLGDQWTRTEKLLFIETYLGDQYVGRKRKRDLVRRIVEETRRQVVREILRHPVVERVSDIGRAEALIEADAMQFQLDKP